ncbi:MAG: hypothetical protein JWN32_2145 [Solirubrobacterales bacterium]|jgi:hypothetical protein|nr:hypothetical protein [Solirubrobacterales bacterium]
MRPRHPDTSSAVENPDPAVSDPASLESAFRAPPAHRHSPIDPQIATPAFVGPRRPQRRAARGRAGRLLTLTRSLWIIVRERAK